MTIACPSQRARTSFLKLIRIGSNVVRRFSDNASFRKTVKSFQLPDLQIRIALGALSTQEMRVEEISRRALTLAFSISTVASAKRLTRRLGCDKALGITPDFQKLNALSMLDGCPHRVFNVFFVPRLLRPESEFNVFFPLRIRFVSFVALVGIVVPTGIAQESQESLGSHPAIISRGFVFEEPPFEECHASSICETSTGLIAAWFGGPYEKHPKTSIWTARFDAGAWQAPQQVADGVQHHQIDGDDKRHPCWNPVLVRDEDGRLHLFYKVGPSPTAWWGMVMTSLDDGLTWSLPMRLPEGILGPIKNKPVRTVGDLYLFPSSTESSSGWRVHFEFSRFPWTDWTRTDSSSIGGIGGGIQPSILTLSDGRLKALCRCDGRAGKILQTISNDGGRHWLGLSETVLPNPNSGLDAITLDDGRHVLVYNHTKKKGDFPCDREMLNVAISSDSNDWFAALTLEKEQGKEFSYPAIIKTASGQLHITYTWDRKRIAHVVLDPAKLRSDIVIDGDSWPISD